MSISTMDDYTELLESAINQAKAKAPQAADELRSCASRASRAVAEVTEGTAVLELVPINQGKENASIFQLQLRKVESESPPSDLGIYQVTAAGYPIFKWYSRGAWESRPEEPEEQFSSVAELDGNFRWMLSQPESRLVLLVMFFKEQNELRK